MTLQPGTRLGAYTIDKLLGVGGMGEVYEARDARLGRRVALKILPSDLATSPDRRARFEREARAVAALNHPNIVTLYSLEDSDGLLFITFELVQGETLATLAAHERLPIPMLLRVGGAIADAVCCAHEQGVLHRDLKPANIMVTADGRVKVLDFGLAKLRETPIAAAALTIAQREPLTGPQVVLGTPVYMSPEQAENRPVDERSDIFSLGVILYELAAGERPFKGESVMSVISAILRDTPPPLTRFNPLAPIELAEIVRRCLSKEPSQRYQSARELRDDLDALRQRFEPKTRSSAIANDTTAVATRRSVAVLPFVNLSADPDNEFFADGITEDLIAQLSKMRSLKVISRTSAMQFKKRQVSLRDIAATLGVATVIEGSVRRAGNRVRIVAELVDARTDEDIWADTYDRQLTDIFEIQSDVALQIARALKAELTPGERARLEQPLRVHPEAYQFFLRGRQCAYRYTQEELGKALRFFERAVTIEPQYALAHNGIAWVYMLQAGGHGAGALRPSAAYARAKEAVDRALRFDSLCADAYSTTAFIKTWMDYDWTGADESFRRALDLDPGNAMTLDGYALLMSAQEQFDVAIDLQQHARDLDPLAPVIGSDLATSYVRAGRLDDAKRDAKRLIELDPAFPYGHSILGWAFIFNGEFARGLDELRHAITLSPGNTIFLAQLGEALGLTGERGQALSVLQQLDQMARQRYVAPYHFAYIYTGLGERERAIDLLEQAVDERAGGVYGIKGSFLFTPLREHVRFRALLRRMNLDDRFRSAGLAVRPGPHFTNSHH